MRKWIGVMIMIFVVGFFYTSLQRRQPKNKIKRDTAYLIKEMKKTLTDEYPQNPIDIIEINNEVISIIYGKTVSQEELAKLVEVQRELYAKDLLTLNPLDTHMLEVEREIAMNAEKEIKVIGNKVMNSYSDPPGTMRVQVVHYTNKQDEDLVREYILRQEKDDQSPEDKEWKIYGWENIGIAKTQEGKK